ncbi:putative reverse transcriptase domain-containing protein [Tanacetum coccineum]
MKLMMEVYCPRNEIQQMETELWNLTVKNNDLASYTQRFQELTLLCTRMVPGEEYQIERYVGGLPDNIQWNVMSAEPTRLQDAIRLANSLMDQKLKGYAIRNAENKRKFESNQRDKHAQQPPFKRQNIGGSNVSKYYTAGGNEGRVYVGPHPLCNKYKLHHVRPCTVKCISCGKVGHLTRDWHLKKNCPKLKNQNHGNKPVIPEARGEAYAIGGGDANPGSNVATSTFLLNNHYASVLFNLGADQSFMSTTFSTLLDVIPDTLDVSYDVELADERIVETNIVLRGCIIGLLGHPLNIDLMAVELGSFDVSIGMDWLANNHAVIVYDEKIVCIPFGDKILIVQGDRSDKGKKSTLSIISCAKTQKYMEKESIPTPENDDLFDQLQGSTIYSKIDLRSGYHQLRVRDEDIPRRHLGYAMVITNDILIYSRNKVKHKGHLKQILELLKKEELNWESPKTPIEIHQILGLSGYYQRFIEGFSNIVKPMTKLTQKSVKFDWGEKKEAAFHTLKQKLCSVPILALPKGSENFVVYCDASYKGLGTVLMQKERVIAYASR